MARHLHPLRRVAALVTIVVVASSLAGDVGTGRATIGGNLAAIRLVNYFPSRNAWTYMWTRWQPVAIRRDFARIAALHATTVRLVVQPRVFGFPEVNPVYATRLRRAIELAARNRLTVQLTLFDWWSDYPRVDDSRRWAMAILAPYRDDRRIAFVELQNEIDASDPEALAWARAVLPDARAALGATPLTISARGADQPSGITRLRRGLGDVPVDFLSAHYFGPAERAYSTLGEAKQAAAPLPLLVSETGYSTWAGSRLVTGLQRARWARESEQDHFFRTVETATRLLGLGSAAPWTYADFVRPGIPSGGPVHTPNEWFYGLVRGDGSAKPAAAGLAGFFRRGMTSVTFNNGFERPKSVPGRVVPAQWRAHGAANLEIAREPGAGRSGTAAVRMGSRNGKPTGHGRMEVVPIAPTRPGRTYEAGVWARGRGTSGITRIGITWFDVSGARLSGAASAPLTRGDRRWLRLAVRSTAPTASSYAVVSLETSANRGRVWLDDVAFRRVSQETTTSAEQPKTRAASRSQPSMSRSER